MARGGARNRSGPPPEEDSRTSERRGVVFTALPAEGYKRKAPAFPLPAPTNRELDVWAQAWRTPQAAAWSVQQWRWYTVAQWVRWSVRMEAGDAPASLGTVVVRLADQIGLTPAGLKENGWKIATDEVAEKAATKRRTTPARSSARSRMKVVRSGSEG